MKLLYTPMAVKRLKKIGAKDKPKAKRKIQAIKNDPLIGIPLKGPLQGKRKMVAWPLRVIYSYQPENQTIIIETIDYHGSVYQ